MGAWRARPALRSRESLSGPPPLPPRGRSTDRHYRLAFAAAPPESEGPKGATTGCCASNSGSDPPVSTAVANTTTGRRIAGGTLNQQSECHVPESTQNPLDQLLQHLGTRLVYSVRDAVQWPHHIVDVLEIAKRRWYRGAHLMAYRALSYVWGNQVSFEQRVAYVPSVSSRAIERTVFARAVVRLTYDTTNLSPHVRSYTCCRTLRPTALTEDLPPNTAQIHRMTRPTLSPGHPRLACASSPEKPCVALPRASQARLTPSTLGSSKSLENTSMLR